MLHGLACAANHRITTSPGGILNLFLKKTSTHRLRRRRHGVRSTAACRLALEPNVIDCGQSSRHRNDHHPTFPFQKRKSTFKNDIGVRSLACITVKTGAHAHSAHTSIHISGGRRSSHSHSFLFSLDDERIRSHQLQVFLPFLLSLSLSLLSRFSCCQSSRRGVGWDFLRHLSCVVPRHRWRRRRLMSSTTLLDRSVSRSRRRDVGNSSGGSSLLHVHRQVNISGIKCDGIHSVGRSVIVPAFRGRRRCTSDK